MTIEEKAMAYAADKMCKALDLTPDCINRTDALIPKFCGRDIEEAYEDGATEALAEQWKDPKAELPEVSTEVLCHDGKAHCIDEVFSVGYYNGTEWHTLDGRPIKPTHWMRIPPVKGGEDNA